MYKTILLDIDNTLFDYPKTEKYAIKEHLKIFIFSVMEVKVNLKK